MDDPALLNHIYISHPEFFIASMSDDTKARMIKDGLIQGAKDMLKGIDILEDVKFGCGWIRMYAFQDYSLTQYDKRYCDDEDYIDTETQYDLEDFYKLPMGEIGLEISFTWQRKCSLGHTHYQKRYHLFSAPQWLSMIAHWRLGPDPKDFIREYFPDFFYEV